MKVFENKLATYLLQKLFITNTIGGKTIINYTPIILEDIKKEYYTNKYSTELIKKEFGQNLLTNDNPANLLITKIFQKGGVLINNVLRHLNESIFIKSPIAEKEILFEYSIQIQVSSNKSTLTNKNIILVPKNSGVKKLNEGIIIAETLEN